MIEQEADVGDVVQVKRRRTKAKIRRDRELEEIRQILKTSFGRRFLWRLLAQCGLYETMSLHTELSMAIKSGRRDIALWLLEEINEADKSGVMQLILEDQKDA